MPGVPPPGLRIPLAIVVVALALAAGTAAPAGALPLDPTDVPLTGSTFQAGDGNQDPTASLGDWASVEAAGRVAHSPDRNDEDSAFGEGSHERVPGDWVLVTEAGGVNPRKDNIRDAWSSTDQPGAETFAYLAFAREAAQGTTFVTFELNRAARLWDNGRALVPCRMTGDVLIGYEAEGNAVRVVVRRWVTTEADADSGCAERGTLDEAGTLKADLDVQGAVNEGRIDNALPGAGGVEYGRFLFGEAGIDLDRVFAIAFGDECFAFTSFWMHSRASDSVSSAMKDYVAPRPLDARTCAASGTKFFDLNADGTRDPGEPGVPRFMIFADYDGDGLRDASEPFTVTGVLGRYVLDDIRPPGGEYTLRESLLPNHRPLAWRCSFPSAGTPGAAGGLTGAFPCGWGPIAVADEPRARGRDFGNWYPARLTLRKELYPPDDPARFDLLLNGEVVLPAAGDGATTTLELEPGLHTVSEAGPAGFVSTVECKRDARPAARRAGRSFEPIRLEAGDVAECVFRNRRPGAPAIAIDKSGPVEALFGATLEYRLEVSNIGSVAFPGAAVDVADQGCDDPPELLGKQAASGPDGSPGTLDPGDRWSYRCSHATRRVDGCAPRTLPNSATVSATVDGTTVTDTSTIETQLRCVIPTPEEADDSVSGSGLAGVPPAGRVPPAAGVAGRVRLARLPPCIRRGTQVTIEGVKIARVRLFTGGVRIRGVRVRPLARKVTIRVTRSFAPGRYPVTARVRFQRGSGTPPVSLTRRVRVCRAAAPRFTG